MTYEINNRWTEKEISELAGNCKSFLTAQDRFALVSQMKYEDSYNQGTMFEFRASINFEGSGSNVSYNILEELKSRGLSVIPYLKAVRESIKPNDNIQKQVADGLDKILNEIK